MASETEICNLSINHLGSSKVIADIDTEKSEEATACRRFYDIARDAVLRDFPWPFATKLEALALVENNPTTEWGFSYAYPSNSITLVRICSTLRRDNRQTRIPYRLFRDNEQRRLIYTDQNNAIIEYTFKETDTGKFDQDFVLALSYRLAVYIAPVITGGDPFKLGNRALAGYNFELSTARKNALNEEQPDQIPNSEFQRARD